MSGVRGNVFKLTRTMQNTIVHPKGAPHEAADKGKTPRPIIKDWVWM